MRIPRTALALATAAGPLTAPAVAAPARVAVAGQSLGLPDAPNFRDAGGHLTADGHTVRTGVVFHCSAGKDRTGWGNAVLLTLLGVPRATVEADYLAGNTYTGDPEAVELSWLTSAFDEVDAIYGSFDAYLHQGLMLSDADIAALKAKLLS